VYITVTVTTTVSRSLSPVHIPAVQWSCSNLCDSATLNTYCKILTMSLRNDLYCVEWGVKLYSLTHALVDKPQAQIMCKKSGKTLIPIDKPQVYFVDVVKCVNEVCPQI